ncbi:MAG: hypothetical protein ACKPJD_26325, partial [Planctomycetaceae bacterium]
AGTGETRFNAAVTINSSSSIDAAITTNTVTINSTLTTLNGGSVTITNAGLLDIAPGADMSLDGLFHQDGAGAVQTAGDITTTADNITFTSAVTLTDAHAVAFSTGAGAGNVAFNSTLNGSADFAEDLSITAGTGSVTFTGAVGATFDLGDITIVSALDVTFLSTLAADSFTQ